MNPRSLTAITLVAAVLTVMTAVALAAALLLQPRPVAKSTRTAAPFLAPVAIEKTPQQRINEAWEAMDLHNRGYRLK